MLGATFRSLSGFNYRLWFSGALVSNIGTWMQRTGQDWMVFTELTGNDATAVGFIMALQFGPSLFLLPFAGFVADHFDRRRVLMATQVLQGALALMVLKTLDVLGPQHGYGIARRIEQSSGGLLAVNQGTLYPVLLKLEQERAITSEWGASEK